MHIAPPFALVWQGELMRWKILEIYSECLKTINGPIGSLGVVGGHAREPELPLTEYKSITFYGIESDESTNTKYLDLNLPQPNSSQHDLVLCSQVLEHVYDVKQAIENLGYLVSQGGYIWIACPTSNYPHGSPEFFSAGYTPELVARLLAAQGFQILHAEKYGSARMHFFTHTLQYWPTRAVYDCPLRFRISRYVFRDFFWRTLATFKSPKFNSNLHHATETVVFAQKSISVKAP